METIQSRLVVGQLEALCPHAHRDPVRSAVKHVRSDCSNYLLSPAYETVLLPLRASPHLLLLQPTIQVQLGGREMSLGHEP